MKRLVVGLCLVFSATVACRAAIIVSGDVNIGNGIDGSAGGIVGDNGRFFANVLGNGTRVVLQEGYSQGSAVTSYSAISNFYKGRGVTVDVTTGAFTASDLAGANC